MLLGRGLLRWEYSEIRLLEAKADPSNVLKVRTAQQEIWEVGVDLSMLPSERKSERVKEPADDAQHENVQPSHEDLI